MKTRSDALDDGYGSVGPIRHIRNKFASEARHRGSISIYSSQRASPQVEKSSVSKGFLPAMEKNMELGGTSGASKYQSVEHMVHSSEEVAPTSNPPCNEVLNKIIEHLDRHRPTPAEKAAELKLATEWKKSSPSEVTGVLPKENSSLLHLGGIDSQKNIDLVDKKLSAGGNGDNGKSNYDVKYQERSNNEATNAIDGSIKASSAVIGDTGVTGDANAGPTLGFKNTCDSRIMSTNKFVFKIVYLERNHACSINNQALHFGIFASLEISGDVRVQGVLRAEPPLKQVLDNLKLTNLKAFVATDDRPKETSQLWRFPNQANGPDITTISNAVKPQSHPSVTKPNLASISIDKPDPRRGISSDNGFGFTFPVSASSDVLLEPPTPSIMPLFSATGLPQQPALPSYSFGTKKSAKRVVFSFPSSSSASAHDDASDIKFSFGSDKKNRISFTSIGKDAICY
ncbi:unnamed protein product [Ilex paraguariensis]|uniref:Uncharacterized protein n=1 Tax=Ilex paraguariensis TaxID=185542 RepID=A0ABC8QUP7_9AQUA